MPDGDPDGRPHGPTGGALVSYDPNLRPRLWPDESSMRRLALAGFAEADVAKVSKDELYFLAPDALDMADDVWEASAAAHLIDVNPRLRLICVTDGGNGCAAYTRDPGDRWRVPAFPVTVLDATGAGDAFTAGLLTFLLRQGPNLAQTFQRLSAIGSPLLTYANACGALAATELGAGCNFSMRRPSRTCSPRRHHKGVTQGTMAI